jgi:general secretion pathway protein I
MNDIEEQLQKDGFSDFDDEKHGTFDDDGASGFAWRAEILKPDVQLDSTQLLNLLGLGGNTTTGTSSSSNASSPLTQGLAAAASALGAPATPGGTSGATAATAGPFAGLLQTQAQGFLETLKRSVREVRVTVSWQDGKDERSVSASQEVVILPESVGKTEQPQTQQTATQPGAPAVGQPTVPIPGRASP